MANVNVTSDAWTEISITSGTVQNISATADIELSAEQTDNSGVVLKPSELYQWDNETIYARAVTEETGALRVVNFKKAAGGGGGYVLPVASASTLGGVKVGNNLSIDASGVLSANSGGYTLPPATASTLGGVIIGDNVTVDANGEISVAAPYSLPTAAANTLGGVKVGNNLTIDASGVLSATGGGAVNYSTTEQQIGTWIDGKPLYQKTFVGNYSPVSPPALLEVEIDGDCSYIDLIVGTDVCVYTSEKYFVFDSYYDTNYYINLMRRKNSTENKLILTISKDWSAISQSYLVTIKYTKTTD